MIELDANATTRPSPGVVEAVRRALTETWHNPSSVHRAGQGARRAVELAREQVGSLLNASPREITFTSGGTEAIDLGVRGRIGASAAGDPVIVTWATEHHAVREVCADLEQRRAARVRLAPLAADGCADPDALGPLLEGAALVVLQWANNETGAVQPVGRVGRLCRERGIPFLCDGTQWVGKMPADVSRAPFDMLAVSPHKFHGPPGVGALWVRSGLGLRPMIRGTQELGRRGGTENVPGIVGAGVACVEARAWLADRDGRARGAALRDRFEAAVRAGVEGAVVNGPADPAGTDPDAARRLWNTSNIGFPRLEAEAVLIALSEMGVNASAGAACSSGSLEPSPVLLAMGVPETVAHGSVRFSLSRTSTEAEVDAGAAAVGRCVGRLRAITGA